MGGTELHRWRGSLSVGGSPALLPVVGALPDLMECADDQGDGAGMLSRAVAEAAMSPLEMTHSGNAVDATAPQESA